jgi:dTDP-4-dehydrorhamnose 3,5-epimerase
MIAHPTSLPGVLIVEPRVFADERGFFLESFRDERFAALGLPTQFRQDNRSRSYQGVLRGLHYQLTRPQGKLVTVLHGEIFDVSVDVRRGSPTFGRWVGVRLTADEPRLVWIPPGFAHGFYAVTDAEVAYKCTEVYVPDDERGVLWSDPTVGIAWPGGAPKLSKKDSEHAPLDPARGDLPTYAG